MADLHAACPDCQHDFRISEAVCAMADGQVRCGYCQRVFHAPSHARNDIRDDQDEDAASDEKAAATFPPLPDATQLQAPIELDTYRRPRHSRLRRVALFSLALLLALGLAGQYIWYNRDTLQQSPRMRTLLIRLCMQVDCRLLALEDLDALRTQQLVVASHPLAEDALQVRFTFRNTAAFEQPFPGVELTFLDARDHPVATRRFSPREYLPQGLSQFTHMPVDTLVQGELAILDPGDDAVDYRLYYHPAASVIR